MIRREPRFLTIIVLFTLTALFPWSHLGAQTDSVPGVRGTLYESPAFGWILIVPEPAWEIASAETESGYETVHLVSAVGDGADAFILASGDDGRGAEGCVQDIVDSLAAAYEGVPLQGWNEPEIERNEFDPDQLLARVRVPASDDPALDLLALIECTRGQDDVLIGQILLRTARDVEESAGPPLLVPLWPGEGHTGRARDGRDPGAPEEGVVRFLARTWPPTETYPFPFWCIDQETFPRPPDAPPPDRGWFACDGQIANIDVVPATIDLELIALGCANMPAGSELPSGCPNEPVTPSYYEVLQVQGPAGAVGPVLTLGPGESVEVVLWYALPEGEPPPDILYVESDRTIVVGPTFYSAGSGSRPRVRVGR